MSSQIKEKNMESGKASLTNKMRSYIVMGIWDVCWCRLVSVCICCCPELSRYITGRGFWEHNNEVYACLDAWSKCSILEKNSERQNSTHGTPLIHKNTNTTLNNLPKIIGFWGLSENNYFSQSCWITLYQKSATIFMICIYFISQKSQHITSPKSPAGIGGSAKAPRTPRKRRRDGKSNFIVCSLAAATWARGNEEMFQYIVKAGLEPPSRRMEWLQLHSKLKQGGLLLTTGYSWNIDDGVWPGWSLWQVGGAVRCDWLALWLLCWGLHSPPTNPALASPSPHHPATIHPIQPPSNQNRNC